MCQALAHCHQNDKMVAEYTHELQELFNMIGDIPEQDKVIKFWNGSRPVLQKGLWCNNFNPEISTWDEVVNQAKIIKISKNVAEWQNHRVGQPTSHGVSRNAHTSGKIRSNTNHQDRSKKSVTFDADQRSDPWGHSYCPSQFHSKSWHWDNRRAASSTSTSRQPSQGRFNSQGKLSVPHIYRTDSHPGIPHLSEKEELQAARKCFICKETGHMSRNCPRWNTVRSNNQKLPGASTFNIELAPAPHESDIDDSVKVLDSLPVGLINLKLKSSTISYLCCFTHLLNGVTTILIGTNLIYAPIKALVIVMLCKQMPS